MFLDISITDFTMIVITYDRINYNPQKIIHKEDMETAYGSPWGCRACPRTVHIEMVITIVL